MAHIESAKELAGKRDRATELEKTQLEDRLREMKIAETRLRTEYDAQLLKFRTWKQEHANEIAKPENDPDVKKWMQEMAALRPRIPGLAY
jgi:cell division septum initiation protein DivIVA